jgi:chitodextrinase
MKESRRHIAIFSARTSRFGTGIAACLTAMVLLLGTNAAQAEPPIADVGGPYDNVEVGIPFTFDGSGSTDPDGEITVYSWTFGDGGTGFGVAPKHTYLSADIYNVTLTVTDDDSMPVSETT